MLTEKQLQARREGIGASEAGIVMGDNAYCTAYELWMIKTGRMQPEDLSNNEAVFLGNKLEGVIADWYEFKHGKKLRKDNRTLRHSDYPHILCHLDRKVEGERKIIEIKTANYFAWKGEEWGPDGSNNIPDPYIWQIQHQLAVTGYQEAELVVWPKTAATISCHPIKRDDELIQIMLGKLNHFWFEHVVKDVAPPMEYRKDVELAYPQNRGNFVEATLQTLEAINDLSIIKEGIKQNQKMCGPLETIITEAIGEADGLTADGHVLCTWKANKTGKRVLRFTNAVEV